MNARKVLKARKSKRQTLHNKHKIEKKVREHLRKLRRDARRNPHLHRRKKKDPGIPNSWPFKQQLLINMEAQHHEALADREAEREGRILERKQRRQTDAALAAATRQNAQQRRDARRREVAFMPLQPLLASAEVCLIVLDARDPTACRSAALEKALLECGKLPVLVLNKSELVPTEVMEVNLATLCVQLPTLPFSAILPEHAVTGAAALGTLIEAFRAHRGGDAPVRVGVVGFDHVGKRSLLRALISVNSSTKSAEYLRKPARLHPLSPSIGQNDVMLRKCVVEAIPQPELFVGKVLERCSKRALLRHFQIASFDGEEGFLRSFAARMQQLQAAAAPPRPAPTKESKAAAAAVVVDDNRGSAVAVLKYWNMARMPFFCKVGPSEAGEAGASAAKELLGEEGWKAVLGGGTWTRAGGVSSVKQSECVELTSGEADEIDLRADEGRWGSADVENMEEGEEEDGGGCEEEEEGESRGEGEEGDEGGEGGEGDKGDTGDEGDEGESEEGREEEEEEET